MAKNKKNKSSLVIGISVVAILIFALGYFSVSESIDFGRTNDLTNYSVDTIVVGVPFTALVNIGKDLDSFSFIPNFRASSIGASVPSGQSPTDAYYKAKVEILNQKTGKYELVDSIAMYGSSDGRSDVSIRALGNDMYKQGLDVSPKGEDVTREVSYKNVINYVACRSGVPNPSSRDYTSGGGTKHTYLCIYPEYKATLTEDYDSDKDKGSSTSYRYVPKEYNYNSDYIKNGKIEFRWDVDSNYLSPTNGDYNNLVLLPSKNALGIIINRVESEIIEEEVIEEEVIEEEVEVIEVPVECTDNVGCISICESKVPTCEGGSCFCGGEQIFEEKVILLENSKIYFYIIPVVIFGLIALIVWQLRKKPKRKNK